MYNHVLQVRLNPSLIDAWFCLANCTWTSVGAENEAELIEESIQRARKAVITLDIEDGNSWCKTN